MQRLSAQNNENLLIEAEEFWTQLFVNEKKVFPGCQMLLRGNKRIFRQEYKRRKWKKGNDK